MEALVLGCGEAFDERLPNTSVLVRADGFVALLDCGYSVPPRVFENTSIEEIDLIYISHAHADHYFGLPAVLGRWWEDGRTRPLAILSQPAVLDQIRDILEYGYRGLPARFQFPVDYREARAGETIELFGSRFDFAPTRHAVTNYAVRIGNAGKVLCLSGDGMFTDESAALFADADLVLHEAFSFESSPVHSDIGALLGMAERQRVRRLGLTHLRRDVRRSPDLVMEAMGRCAVAAHMPGPGDLLTV